MTIALHNLKKSKSKRKKVRVGRGNASGKGTYSTRGLKGQRSRSGGKKGLKLKGFKQNLLAFPKFKGMKSKRPKVQIVDLGKLNNVFENGDKVNPAILTKKGLIDKMELPVKILNNGEIKIQLTVIDCMVSRAAKEKIEKAGGKIEFVKMASDNENKKE